MYFTENLIGIKKDEERVRRTAEREGRRIRRSKVRGLSASGSHVDGMSSDDEITEMAAAAYRSQKGYYCPVPFCENVNNARNLIFFLMCLQKSSSQMHGVSLMTW